jgi:hypothetical protein
MLTHNYGAENYNDMQLTSVCVFTSILPIVLLAGVELDLFRVRERIIVSQRCWVANQTGVRDLLTQSWVKL